MVKCIAIVTASAALLCGAVNAAEVEVSSDTAEDALYADFIWSLSDNGGDGFGDWVELDTNGGGRFIEGGSPTLGGSRSFGLFAGNGSGSGYSIARPLDTAVEIGGVELSAVHNVNNEVSFTGFNLKSVTGSGFGNGELLSFGLNPGNNNRVLVTGSTQQNLDFGFELRGKVINYAINFDSVADTYEISVMVDSVTRTTSGMLAGSGSLTTLGFANFNAGSSQNLFFDNISVTAIPEPLSVLAGGGLLGLIALRRR